MCLIVGGLVDIPVSRVERDISEEFRIAQADSAGDDGDRLLGDLHRMSFLVELVLF
jgi:hypothetical protein